MAVDRDDLIDALVEHPEISREDAEEFVDQQGLQGPFLQAFQEWDPVFLETDTEQRRDLHDAYLAWNAGEDPVTVRSSTDSLINEIREDPTRLNSLVAQASTGDTTAQAHLVQLQQQLFQLDDADLQSRIREAYNEWQEGITAYRPYYEDPTYVMGGEIATMSDAELMEHMLSQGELTPRDVRFMNRFGTSPSTQRAVDEYRRLNSMSPADRLKELTEHLSFIMAGGDPSGYGDEFSTAETLMGYPSIDPNTGRETFVPGFLQTDYRLGDIANQTGLRPGVPSVRWETRPGSGMNFNESAALVGWMFEDLTPRDARSLILAADGETLMRIQTTLMDAGLYQDGGSPVLGVRTPADFAALDALININYVDQRNIPELLRDMTSAEIQNTMSEYLSEMETYPEAVYSLTDREALKQMGDEIGFDGAGRRPTPEQLDRAIAVVHGRERRVAEERERIRRQNYEMNRADDIDRFMRALAGQESGGDYNAVGPVTDYGTAKGKYQFIDDTWKQWSLARFGEVVPQTPQNQEEVARMMVTHYYQKFGNWADVARAWYAGEFHQSIRNPAYGNQLQVALDGGVVLEMPTINEYVASVMRRFNEGQLEAVGERAANAGVHFVETPDPRAILNRELRAADEVGWQSWEFATAASNFYSLLGSLY